ncbi:hypothetical protein BH24DEI2_BH24DEI2_18360 [soil metagenome]
MKPMPFERLTIQASDDATTREWLSDLSTVLEWYYPEDARQFGAVLSARLRRPDIRPATADDGGLYFVQLLERTRTLSTEALSDWLEGVPLLETLLERKIVEVQLVERLVLPDPVDVPG